MFSHCIQLINVILIVPLNICACDVFNIRQCCQQELCQIIDPGNKGRMFIIYNTRKTDVLSSSGLSLCFCNTSLHLLTTKGKFRISAQTTRQLSCSVTYSENCIWGLYYFTDSLCLKFQVVKRHICKLVKHQARRFGLG